MNIKVLLRLYWHTGIPDGKNHVDLIVEDFDITNEEIAVQKITEALQEYGATDISFDYSLRYIPEYEFKASIMDKSRYRSPLFQPSPENVNVKAQWVQEHHGCYFEMKQVEVNIR